MAKGLRQACGGRQQPRGHAPEPAAHRGSGGYPDTTRRDAAAKGELGGARAPLVPTLCSCYTLGDGFFAEQAS